MKKAKILLTAMVVIAVVSGAMAFKAKKLGINLFVTDGTPGSCTKEVNLLTFDNSNATSTFTDYATASDGPCAITTYYQVAGE